MKRGKKACVVLLSALLAASMTGCGGAADWDSAKPLIERARDVGSEEKETAVLQDFLKNCRDADDFSDAAEYYEKRGQPEQAESILAAGVKSLQKRKDDDNEDLTEEYFELLAEDGKLSAVRQNAPDLAKLPVNGKPFSEYDRESLLALIPSENITYVSDDPTDDNYYYDAAFSNVDLNISGSTDDTYPHYSISFYNLADGKGSGRGEGPEPVLPDGITIDMDMNDCMQTLGFTKEQAALLRDYSSVTVYLEERDMEFYVYDYSPGDDYRYFQINYDLRSCEGALGFNFSDDGLDSYELSWSA